MRLIIPEFFVKFKYYSRTPGYETLRVIGMSLILSILSLALIIGCAVLFMLLAGIIHPSRIIGQYSAGHDSQKIINISKSPEEREIYYQGFLDMYRMRNSDGI
jgi:hypothetical protein